MIAATAVWRFETSLQRFLYRFATLWDHSDLVYLFTYLSIHFSASLPNIITDPLFIQILSESFRFFFLKFSGKKPWWPDSKFRFFFVLNLVEHFYSAILVEKFRFLLISTLILCQIKVAGLYNHTLCLSLRRSSWSLQGNHAVGLIYNEKPSRAPYHSSCIVSYLSLVVGCGQASPIKHDCYDKTWANIDQRARPGADLEMTCRLSVAGHALL